MKKKYIIIINLVFSSLVNAANDGCTNSVLFGVGPGGNSTQWLYKELPSTTNHPHEADTDPNGAGCNFNVQITTPNDTSTNVAYYTKNHNDPSEVRFRFILATEDLLQSFDTAGDTLQLYNFMYQDVSNVEHQLLKVRLKKNNPATDRWEVKTQWFDTVNGGSVRQSVYFDESDDFVEFEFFWEKLSATNSAYVEQFTRSQAGVMLKAG